MDPSEAAKRQAARAAARAPGCASNIPPTLPESPIVDRPPDVRRPPAPCDPAAPDVQQPFVVPTDRPSVPPLLNTPGTIQIGNDEIVLTCADVEGAGPSGDSVTILQSTITQDFVWLDIPTLTPEQLDFISRTDVSQINTRPLLDGSLEDVMNLLHVTRAQAESIQTVAAAVKASLNAQAEATARAAIVCGWYNSTAQSACPGSALDNPLIDDRVNHPSVVPAGSIFSRISEADATANAQVLALGALRCFYGNVEVTVTCADLGFTDPVATDAEVSPVGIQRVSSVTILANTVVTDNQATSDLMARDQAMSQLVCAYLNPLKLYSCEDISAMGTLLQAPGSVQGQISGNPVTAEFGVTLSTKSPADAEAQAFAAAKGLLICEWGNSPLTLTCTAQTVPNPLNPAESVTMNPSAKSPVLAVTVEAAAYVSTISQADADSMALLFARAQLDCLYCNSITPPTCVPESIYAGVADGTIPLPVPLSLVTSLWADDATLGAAAGTFCDADPTIAAQLAATVLPIPISALAPSATQCRYGNDRLNYSCINGQLPSPPDLQNSVTIAKDTYMVALSDVPATFTEAQEGVPREKLYANALALVDARATLNCAWWNVEKIVTCESAFSKFNVHPTAIGSEEHPVLIEANSFPSVISQADADMQALSVGMAQLDCFYLSRKTTVLCGARAIDANISLLPSSYAMVYGSGALFPLDASGFDVGVPVPILVSSDSTGSLENPIVLEEAEHASTQSQLHADTLAFKEAIRHLDCFWYNFSVELRCGAANSLFWGRWMNSWPDWTSIVDGGGFLNGGFVTPAIGSAAQPALIEGKTYKSKISRYDACVRAYNTALAMLTCCWGNKITDRVCGQVEGGPIPDEDKISTPSAFAHLKAHLDQDTVPSCFSQAAADLSAWDLMGTMLVCSYTNKAVGAGNGGDAKCAAKNCETEGPTDMPEGLFHSPLSSAFADVEAKLFLSSLQECKCTTNPYVLGSGKFACNDAGPGPYGGVGDKPDQNRDLTRPMVDEWWEERAKDDNLRDVNGAVTQGWKGDLVRIHRKPIAGGKTEIYIFRRILTKDNTGRDIVVGQEEEPVKFTESSAQGSAAGFNVDAGVPSGSPTVTVSPSTLFGDFPAGMNATTSVSLHVSTGDKIYAAVKWDGRVLADGSTTGTFTNHAIEKAATTPTNDPLNGLFYFELASITGMVTQADGTMSPVVHQTLWGPIDKLPGTVVNPYLMPPSPGDQGDAQTDYYDLTVTGKGKDTDDADLAPTYDSVQMNKTGFVRFVNDDGNLKAFIRPPIINSIGQIVAAGPEELAVEHIQIDVLVGMRLYDGQLQGQYKKVWVMKNEASAIEWKNLLSTRRSSPVTCM